MKKVSIIICTVFLIFGTYPHLSDFSLYDSKRILQLAVLTIIGLFFCVIGIVSKRSYINFTINNLKFKNRILGLNFVLVVLLFSTSVSILLSNYPEKAVVDVLFHLILLLLAYLVSSTFLKEHYWLGKVIYITALSYVGLYIVLFIGNYISSFLNPLISVWPNNVDYSIDIGDISMLGKEVLFFVNRRFFNHTQTWTFPLIIGLFVFFKRSKDYKNFTPLIFIIISLWWMMLFQSGGRGTTLSIFVAAAFLWAFSRKDFTPFVRPLIVSSLAGWGLKYLLFDLPFSGSGQAVLRTQNNRTFRWEGALEVWWENPFFGIGPGHYGEIGPTQFVGHPHNYYLQILSEWGVFAFICISILFFVAASFAWKKFEETKPGSTNRLNFLVMSWVFIAACCHAFFSGVMHTPLSQMWLVLILAWFIGYYKREYNYKFKTDRVPVMAYVISLAIVLYIVIPDVLTLSDMYQAYAEQYPGQSLYPRFWGQGLFPVE
ncbi:O-antigen ligase family protein [Rhodohalobacter barkolensis]|nr:O-antigen ligase family protein [Rhodohalobacter barkolensis]